jgi:hypothetical protein
MREGYPKSCTGCVAAGRFRVGSRWVSLCHMVSDPELYELAARVAHKLRAAQRRLVTAAPNGLSAAT